MVILQELISYENGMFIVYFVAMSRSFGSVSALNGTTTKTTGT